MLFIYVCVAVLGLCCSAGFSLIMESEGYSPVSVCRLLIAVAFLVAKHGLQSMQASVVVAHGLSCSTACAIFPDQGSNPCPLHWQADSLLLSHQGNPHLYNNINATYYSKVWISSNLFNESPILGYLISVLLLLKLLFLQLFLYLPLYFLELNSQKSNCYALMYIFQYCQIVYIKKKNLFRKLLFSQALGMQR